MSASPPHGSSADSVQPRPRAQARGEQEAVMAPYLDPVALELGGQVERLLQARLLRLAHSRCHGLDDGTQEIPLLDAKDRVLLSIWHRWSTLQQLDVTGGLIGRVARALGLALHDVVVGQGSTASPTWPPSSSSTVRTSSVGFEDDGGVPPQPPLALAQQQQLLPQAHETSLEKPGHDGGDDSVEMTEDHDDEELEQEAEEEAWAFPVFIASLDDGASLCAMYFLEQRSSSTSTTSSSSGSSSSSSSSSRTESGRRGTKRRRSKDSTDQGQTGQAEGALTPESLRVYVSEGFAATFFETPAYAQLLTQRLPECVHAYLVERGDRQGFIMGLANTLLKGTLAAGLEPPPLPSASNEEEGESEQGDAAARKGEGQGEGEDPTPTSSPARDERSFSQVLRCVDRYGRYFLGLCRVRLCLTRRGGVAGAIAITPLPPSKYVVPTAAGMQASEPRLQTMPMRCGRPHVHPWVSPASPFHPQNQRLRPAPHEQLEDRLHFLDWRRFRPDLAEEEEEQEEKEASGRASQGGAAAAAGGRKGQGAMPLPFPEPFVMPGSRVVWTPIGADAAASSAAGTMPMPPYPFVQGGVAAPGGLPPRPPPLSAPHMPEDGPGVHPPNSSPFRQLAGLVSSPGVLYNHPSSGDHPNTGEGWFNAFVEAFYDGPPRQAPEK